MNDIVFCLFDGLVMSLTKRQYLRLKSKTNLIL